MRDRVSYDELMDSYQEIFEGLYTVHINQMFTYTEDAITRYGIPMTGDDEWDKSMAYGHNRVMLTIAELADHHADGVKFYPVHTDSIPLMYEHVKRYLRNIGKLFSQSYITPAQVKSNEDLAKVMHDLHRLVDFANMLRPAISWINEEAEAKDIEETKKTNSLLSLMTYRRDPNDVDTEISSLPEQLKVESAMHQRFSGQTRNWDVTTTIRGRRQRGGKV